MRKFMLNLDAASTSPPDDNKNASSVSIACENMDGSCLPELPSLKVQNRSALCGRAHQGVVLLSLGRRAKGPGHR